MTDSIAATYDAPLGVGRIISDSFSIFSAISFLQCFLELLSGAYLAAGTRLSETTPQKSKMVSAMPLLF